MDAMEKRVVIIQHVPSEGPGLLEGFFVRLRWPFQIVDLNKGDRLPDDLGAIAAVISLGGPMNVYEEERFPFLREEDRFITRLLVEETPFLGICLGAQLLARACGAAVSKAPEKEFGWSAVTVTDQGRRDRLFAELPGRISVFQWHEDTFELPSGAVLLAEGRTCAHQAFRVGNCAYGLQFHMEVTETMVREWSAGRDAGCPTGPFSRTARARELFEQQAARLMDNFRQIVESSLRIKRVIGMFIEDEKISRRRRPILWWQKDTLTGLKLVTLRG